MRSDLIFPAVKTVQNRYTLCQLASKATRKFHKPSTRIQETMNEILQRMGSSQPDQIVGHTEVLAEVQKRAA